MDQFKTSAPDIGDVKKPKAWWKKFAKVYLAVFLVALVFCLGVIIGISQAPNQRPVKYSADKLIDIFANSDKIDPDLFAQVWDILHTDYLDKNKINDQDLFYGAISGIVRALGDPHSVFLTPELTKDFNQELNGTFYGIGAEISRKNGFLLIVAPLSDTPAERAGLKAGDKILAIDNVDTSDMSSDEAVSLIRGDRGTTVVLTVYSEGDQSTRDVSIVRDKISVPSVVYKLEDKIAIIKISSFNNDTNEFFAKAAQKALNDNPKGIILDLRNNPGGFLDTAVDITSYWLEPGQVVVRETFSDKRNDSEYKASKKISLAHIKTMVLVNNGSASASEILAGALQDYGQATVIGKTTFGKGSVQQLIPLKDNASIKLTVARWLTPKGRTIEGEGIKPDIEVDLTSDDYNNDLDPQLDKAKELLNQ